MEILIVACAVYSVAGYIAAIGIIAYYYLTNGEDARYNNASFTKRKYRGN